MFEQMFSFLNRKKNDVVEDREKPRPCRNCNHQHELFGMRTCVTCGAQFPDMTLEEFNSMQERLKQYKIDGEKSREDKVVKILELPSHCIRYYGIPDTLQAYLSDNDQPICVMNEDNAKSYDSRASVILLLEMRRNIDLEKKEMKSKMKNLEKAVTNLTELVTKLSAMVEYAPGGYQYTQASESFQKNQNKSLF